MQNDPTIVTNLRKAVTPVRTIQFCWWSCVTFGGGLITEKNQQISELCLFFSYVKTVL